MELKQGTELGVWIGGGMSIPFWRRRKKKGFFMHSPEKTMNQILIKYLGKYVMWINVPFRQ